MPGLANQPKADLSRGFIVAQVAEKPGWTEPMVWSIALKDKNDFDRFKALNWGLRTWDLWNWNDCDKRFGDDWPGRIPAQMIAPLPCIYLPGKMVVVIIYITLSFRVFTIAHIAGSHGKRPEQDSNPWQETSPLLGSRALF